MTLWRSFWRGFGSALSLCDYEPSPEIQRILDRTDEEAMALDWQTTGDDLRRAMQKIDPPSAPATDRGATG